MLELGHRQRQHRALLVRKPGLVLSELTQELDPLAADPGFLSVRHLNPRERLSALRPRRPPALGARRLDLGEHQTQRVALAGRQLRLIRHLP